MTVLFTLLLLLAGILTAALGGMISGFHESDAAGQGMTQGFAFVAAILLWILFGVLLVICGARGGFEGWVAAIVPIVYLCSASAQFAALSVLQSLEKGERFESPLHLASIAIPCLVILYCGFSFFPGLRASIPSGSANLWVGLPIIAATAIPWLIMGPAKAAISARTEARNQIYRESQEREQRLIAEISALPSGTPLAAFLRYTDVPPTTVSDSRQAAIARMRTLPTRQSEAVELLRRQDTRLLRDLSDLDLEMTPALCEAGRNSARKLVEQFKPSNSVQSFESIEGSLTSYFLGVQWLLNHGCDCKADIAALEQTVRFYPFSYPRAWFTDNMLRLQGKPREAR